MIPRSQWRWDGHAGHLIISAKCRFHLNTRIGDYRISTVGDYFPDGADTPQEIGARRTHETFVFRVSGPGGGDCDWLEIDSDVYSDCDAAREGHMSMCLRYAKATP